jgi:hypothetical protein
MFLVTESVAAAIRTIYEQDGELSAAIELRRLLPGITDNAEAHAHATATCRDQSLNLSIRPT